MTELEKLKAKRVAAHAAALAAYDDAALSAQEKEQDA